jgi:hypothetical protein
VKFFIALAAAAVCTMAAVAQPKPGDCSIMQYPDGTATIRGTVVRNDHSCIVDGGCYLVLGCPGSEIAVYYSSTGDLPENSDAYRKARSSGAITAAVNAAFDIRAGEEIEAHGPATTRNGKISRIRTYYDGCWLKTISSEGAETISVAPPQGPASGFAGKPLTFTVHASSNLGHSLQYTIQWGDGQETVVWGSRTQYLHTWQTPGTYNVTVKARCEQDQIPAVQSDPFVLTIR